MIFVFFGYNESFAGETGATTVQVRPRRDDRQVPRPEVQRQAAPRFVLFARSPTRTTRARTSPTAGATTSTSPLYTGAIKQVAGEKGVAFVDLFDPSQALYRANRQPLTLNGVHLLPEGNQPLGRGHRQRRSPARPSPPRDSHRSRCARRSSTRTGTGTTATAPPTATTSGAAAPRLKFVNGQTNREVLQHELTMLDVMTANRDPKIWARGRRQGPTRSTTPTCPPPVEVISNVGGGSRSSSAAKEGIDGLPRAARRRSPRCTCRRASRSTSSPTRRCFPGIANPVQMQVDTKGRLWAACWNTYPKWEPLKQMTDSLHHPPRRERRRGRRQGDRVRQGPQPARLRVLGRRRDRHLAARHPVPEGHRRRRQGRRPHRPVPGDRLGRHPPRRQQPDLRSGRRRSTGRAGFSCRTTSSTRGGRRSTSTASGMYRFDPRALHHHLPRRQQPEPPRHQLRLLGLPLRQRRHRRPLLPGAPRRQRLQDVPAGQQGGPPGPGRRDHFQRQLPGRASSRTSSSATRSATSASSATSSTATASREGKNKLRARARSGARRPTTSSAATTRTSAPPTPSSARTARSTSPTGTTSSSATCSTTSATPTATTTTAASTAWSTRSRPLQEKVAIDGQPIAALLENLKHPIDGVRHRTRDRIERAGLRRGDRRQPASGSSSSTRRRRRTPTTCSRRSGSTSSTTSATRHCSRPCSTRRSSTPGSPPPP